MIQVKIIEADCEILLERKINEFIKNVSSAEVSISTMYTGWISNPCKYTACITYEM